MIHSTTVVAPATPGGVGGLAVIRLSGARSLSLALTLVNKKTLRVRYAHFASFREANGAEIDEGILLYYKGPESYTGEDVVEIMCHGNPLIVQALVRRCRELGADLAGPGEFTQRAFLNGKYDLIQAESVGALISAQSTVSAALNTRLIKGQLSHLFTEIKAALVSLLARVEFDLDISEDELQPDLIHSLNKGIAYLRSQLNTLAESYARGRLLTRGARVVIVGKPNAGKSTLLNALAGSDRAITSPKPGTTRDSIEVALVLRGVVVTLVDTAGLREAQDEIEKEGVRRTRRSMAEADCILVVHDLTNDHSNNTLIDIPDIPFLEVFNKYDLIPEGRQPDNLKKQALIVSAQTGCGLDRLEAALVERLGLSTVSSSQLALTTARQLHSVESCQAALSRASALLGSPSVPLELVAVELREAITAVDMVLGKTTPDDIIESVFQSFCVGK